ncbi:MAG: transposase, partial [Deltaproteobacteria bacterium]|nr:transposase [Deltaproteobacteria bacterium]
MEYGPPGGLFTAIYLRLIFLFGLKGRRDLDRESFLDILVQSKKIYGVRLFAYVLMDNHFHLLLETPLGNLGEFMRRFNITYTSYFNRTHNRVGHLFQGRYKSILVDKESYLSELSRYIHLNPVRIKEQKNKTPEEQWHYLVNYPWSSLKGYLSARNKEPFMEYSLILADFGGDTSLGRRAYQNRIKEDLLGELKIKEKVIGQAILGGDHFIKWLKETFSPQKQDRECPGLNELKRYRVWEEIIEVFYKETGKSVEEVKVKKHPLRAVLMDLLYRIGGLTGAEIGKIFNVDYSTVS